MRSSLRFRIFLHFIKVSISFSFESDGNFVSPIVSSADLVVESPRIQCIRARRFTSSNVETRRRGP